MKHQPARRRYTSIALTFLAASVSIAAASAGEDTVYTAEELEALLSADTRMAKPESARQELASLLSRPAGDPLTEHQLHEALLALKYPLDPETRSMVTQLMDREERILVWMEHSGLPSRKELAIDVAATARWAMKTDAAHRQAIDYVQRFSRPQALSATMPEKAWSLVPEHAREIDKELLKSALLDRLQSGEAVEKALFDIATNEHDVQLASQLISSGAPERLTPMLGQLLAEFPGAERSLIETALRRPELAAGAVGQLAGFSQETWAREILKRSLAERRTGTASAVVIARSGDDALLADMLPLMLSDSPSASRAALALHMSDTAYARQLLQSYLDAAPDGRYRDQVEGWLK